MKKLLVLMMILSCVFVLGYADEGQTGKHKGKGGKCKKLTEEERAELNQKRIEKITEKLREKGKSDAEIAEILKKREEAINRMKARVEEYKAKLKAEGKTDEEIEKLLEEKREKFCKKMKKHHKNKKNHNQDEE